MLSSVSRITGATLRQTVMRVTFMAIVVWLTE
jgi:hypothetical protein